ncbi:MAG: lipopolysaccharide transport system ATP-binding protein [Acidobacteriota bacterium]|jgi:lipopolysaccharide transport system ATP-binding protein|nr:lipopolysaccharide transport system ATP-binding protein [Acidobacteriota bacterium]
MTEPGIVVENLAKRYRLGGFESYRTLRDRIAGIFGPRTKQDSRELWALRDVNLTIGMGEAVGLIGHNGAGKSTLLKILSRITEPTEGQALLYGRVASLLEVGTGFHPELTGRENIYLNGAILGMTRAEIRRNFDDIVAFAEIERFLDTPVKRYSSGMYVRLAFAVAAHLTPEILLVDEVLAVGDIEFQRRCLGRMNEVARSGRTVVFVSHNLGSIESLCPRSILMSGGKVAVDGKTRDVIAQYVSRRGGEAMLDLRAFADREGTGGVRLTGIELLSEDGARQVDEVTFGESFRIRFRYQADERLPAAAFGFALLTEKNERVFVTESTDSGMMLDLLPGDGAVDLVLHKPNVLPDTYRLEAWIVEVGVNYTDHVRMIGSLPVLPGTAQRVNVTALTTPGRGVVYVDADWVAG